MKLIHQFFEFLFYTRIGIVIGWIWLFLVIGALIMEAWKIWG